MIESHSTTRDQTGSPSLEIAAGDEALVAPDQTFALDYSVKLTAVVRAEEAGGYSAEVPGLIGCFTEGTTLEELRDNLREATEGWQQVHYDLARQDACHEALKRATHP